MLIPLISVIVATTLLPLVLVKFGNRLDWPHVRSADVNTLSKTGDAHTGLVALERSGIGPGALSPIEMLTPGPDATRVASSVALLVPAVVSLFGRWNWWLPAWPARLLRVKPSLPRPSSEGAGG